MKIVLRSCFLFLLLIFVSMTTTYAETSSGFIGNYPFFDGYRLAKVHFVGARNTFGEQAIFLKVHNIIVKIHSKNYTHVKDNEIAGYFNKTEKQMFYNHKTGESFEGQVVCKRLLDPNIPTIEPTNIYIKGKNNTYANNTVIKGENNISRNNVYIAGSNNTITGNTHYQGSNNVYEDNVVIGSSNNTITNTTTYGSSNRTVKGQVINRGSFNAESGFDIVDLLPVKTPSFYVWNLGFALISGIVCMWRWKKSDNLACFFLIIFTCSASIFVIGMIPSLLSLIPTKIKYIFIGIFLFVLILYLLYKYPEYKKERDKLDKLLHEHQRKLEQIRIEREKKLQEEKALREARQKEAESKQKEAESKQKEIELERKEREKELRLKYKKEQKYIATLPLHYVGNVETGICHISCCFYAKKLDEQKKEYFKTKEDAEHAGYRFCFFCENTEKNYF